MSTIEQPVQDGEAAREQWLQDRRGAIGSSDMAAILGFSPYSSAWEVWAEKTGRLAPWSGSKSTKAGQRLENYVLDHAEESMGSLVRNVRIVDTTYPISATMDALNDRKQPIEAKTTGIVGPVIGKWGDALTDQVPEHYIIQVQTQMIVTGADVAHLFALIGGRGIVRYMIPRSPRLCDHLIDTTIKWWKTHVENDVAPELGTVKLETVRRLLQTAGKEIELSETTAALVEEWEAAKEQKSQAEKYADACQARILAELGDAEFGKLPDKTYLHLKEITKASYVVKESKYKTLYHKKGKK